MDFIEKLNNGRFKIENLQCKFHREDGFYNADTNHISKVLKGKCVYFKYAETFGENMELFCQGEPYKDEECTLIYEINGKVPFFFGIK